MPHFGPVHSWSPKTVSKWILGLHPLARQHAGILSQHHVTGQDLLTLTWAALDGMKIAGMYDQEALLSAVSILRDVDRSNKNYLLYPLADRTLSSALEALDHISCLKMEKRDLERKQELYMSCINCGNLTRTILLHMDKYHIVYGEKSKMAHQLLCSLYTVTQAAQQLRLGLKAAGINMPDIPQELPYNVKANNFPACLQASLEALVENTGYMREQCQLVRSRGCPSFERITLQPDGDTGWGFSFRETSTGIYIVKRILANTPADKSGRIKSGDEVIEVNDQNIVGWKIKNVVELIRSYPVGLVMVVRHYPDTSPPPSASITTLRHHSLPQTSLTQTPLTPRNLSRHQHVSGTMSEPPCPNDASLMEPQCPIDTPKKPPRPLDSVLRERCKSNNELDMHFKTVHNPKRLSQIYGDSNLFLSFEDMTEEGIIATEFHSAPPHRGKRSNPRSPAYHRRNNSNPLDKYNIVSNRDWLDHVKQRGERSKNLSQYRYGTGPRVRTTKPLDFLNMSMPDIAVSTENVQKVDKSTEYDEHMDATMTSPRNHVTLPSNHVTPPRSRSMNSPRTLSLYREEDSNKLSDEDNNKSDDNDSIATTPSTISNCTSASIMTTDSTYSGRSKTLPRPRKSKMVLDEDVGEFKNYPVSKEQNYTTVVIGGVVHKIPVATAAAPSSEEDNVKCNTLKSRKRQNKRSSWSISSDKAATLPKNIRFSLADLDENGTLKKKKNKKPSRSTSSILGDTNVSCKSLYPNACEGWLLKLGGSGLTPRNWRRRWFVLKGFCLYYFKTPQDSTALGVITLPSFNIATAAEIKKKNAFKASHKNTRTYFFIADSEDDKQRWMDKMLLASILYDESDKESGYGTAGTGASPVATELCSMTIEQSIISPCASLQSISSTTVV